MRSVGAIPQCVVDVVPIRRPIYARPGLNTYSAAQWDERRPIMAASF